MLARHRLLSFAAALLLLDPAGAQAEQPVQVNTIREAFARLSSCWKLPPPSRANPIDITVIVSFNLAGEIFGRPRITYESEQADDNDRLHYRIDVIEALERCTTCTLYGNNT